MAWPAHGGRPSGISLESQVLELDQPIDSRREHIYNYSQAQTVQQWFQLGFLLPNLSLQDTCHVSILQKIHASEDNDGGISA